LPRHLFKALDLILHDHTDHPLEPCVVFKLPQSQILLHLVIRLFPLRFNLGGGGIRFQVLEFDQIVVPYPCIAAPYVEQGDVRLPAARRLVLGFEELQALNALGSKAGPVYQPYVLLFETLEVVIALRPQYLLDELVEVAKAVTVGDRLDGVLHRIPMTISLVSSIDMNISTSYHQSIWFRNYTHCFKIYDIETEPFAPKIASLNMRPFFR
jgi:hypothetical protein